MRADGLPLPDFCVRLVRRKRCDCGALLILVKTKNEKTCPFHRDGDAWIPHWATCPHAKRYRRKTTNGGNE